MLQGSFVALVTPFKHNEVDYNALERLLDFHLTNQTDGIVLLGTTAETAALATDEQERILTFAIKRLKGKLPIVVGTGTYNLHHTISNTLRAKEHGADYALIVTPYYVKPTQDGLYHYFKMVAEKVDIPIILYNVPGRTGVNMLPETVVRLAKDIPNVVAVKEASGNVLQTTEIVRDAPADFIVLSGDDATNMPLMACGAKGSISVTANILPKKMHDCLQYALQGNFEAAGALHTELLEINQVLFIESSPTPVKTALAMMKMMEPEVRLPLYQMKNENRAKLEKALQKLALI